MSNVVSTGSSTATSLDSLVAQYKSSLQAQSVTPLQTKKASITARITGLSTLKSKLQALNDAAGSLNVTRAARADILRSSRFNDASTTIMAGELTSDEQTAGTAARQIKIMAGGLDVTVDVNLTNTDTNNTVLTSIANAINASTDASAKVTATVVAADTGQSRLVLTAKSAGSTNAITVQDIGPGTLLNSLGISASVVSGRTTASSATTADDPSHNPGGYYYSGAAAALDASRSTLFSAFTASSSDSSVGASADSTAVAGTHIINVSQLAKTDSVLTKQFGTDGTSISDALTAEGFGTKKFTVTTGTGSAVEVSVIVSSGQKNSTILSNIAAALNGTAGVGVTASVVNDDSTHSRLVLTSKTSGSANAITGISDTTGSLGGALGLTGMSFASAARTVASTSQTGFLKDNSGLLDAKFKLDGIDIVRGSNTAGDVLKGVTLTLNGQLGTDITLGVTLNTSQIQNNVQSFLNAYNATLSYIKTQTAIDPTTQTRQIFAGDSTVLSLRYSIQSDITKAVTGLGSDPSTLSAFGITAGADGCLTVSDASKFRSGLQADTTKLAQLFDSSDGIATRLVSRLSAYVSSGGSMDATKAVYATQSKSLDDRITRANDRIDRQAQKYRDDFATLQSAYIAATQQQAQMTQLYTSLGLT
jgi:flagellar hook-associated protein 2